MARLFTHYIGTVRRALQVPGDQSP
jgi:hypothetical protein